GIAYAETYAKTYANHPVSSVDLRRKAWIVQKLRIWKNRLVALIILQKSTFPDMRDPAPKTWFGRAACTKPYQA
ncbi:MAG: hypothetical protein ACLR34_10005, partial [Faecalibacterium prausnitzii]